MFSLSRSALLALALLPAPSLIGVTAQSTPTVSIPSISIPSVSIPSVSIPSVSIPSVSIPSISIQTPSSYYTGSLPPIPTSYIPAVDVCILACTELAAAEYGCYNAQNLSCVCTSQEYWSAATYCLQSNCTYAEHLLALDLQVDQCLLQSYVPNPTSLSSALSHFSSAASRALASQSAAYASLSSVYASNAAARSSAVSAYASSLSSVLLADATSAAGIELASGLGSTIATGSGSASGSGASGTGTGSTSAARDGGVRWAGMAGVGVSVVLGMLGGAGFVL